LTETSFGPAGQGVKLDEIRAAGLTGANHLHGTFRLPVSGERTMDLGRIFSIEGRISREDYLWFAVAPLAACLYAFQICCAFTPLNDFWIIPFAAGALAHGSAVSKTIRRFHDLGMPADKLKTTSAYLRNTLPVGLALIVGTPLLRGFSESPLTVLLFAAATTALMVAMPAGGMSQFSMLAFTPGQPGENSYGPAPPRPSATMRSAPQPNAFLSGARAPKTKRYKKSTIGDWGGRS
jgi:uncharacterized membrane protein YhaH (DUF805 family)